MSEALNRDYNVCEEIGRGRYGVVFKAYSSTSGELFAVKSIDKSLIGKAILDRQCLYNEAKVMNMLSSTASPHVLKMVRVYEDDCLLHIVIELCNGGDLYERVTSRTTFSEGEAFVIMKPLMEAIAHCHSLGVVHRDIKLENVLFNDQNELKLADFGSAELFQAGKLVSGLVGTPYYIAPEVVSGRDYDEKVDIWSAGVILYMMLSGFPPFQGQSAREIFEDVLRANLRFPTRIFGSVSPSAKDLIRKMICKDVTRRFSAKQVLGHQWITIGGGGGNRPVDVEKTRPVVVLP